MCLPAKTEQLSLLLGSHGTRPHTSAGGGGGWVGAAEAEGVGGTGGPAVTIFPNQSFIIVKCTAY